MPARAELQGGAAAVTRSIPAQQPRKAPGTLAVRERGGQTPLPPSRALPARDRGLCALVRGALASGWDNKGTRGTLAKAIRYASSDWLTVQPPIRAAEPAREASGETREIAASGRGLRAAIDGRAGR